MSDELSGFLFVVIAGIALFGCSLVYEYFQNTESKALKREWNEKPLIENKEIQETIYSLTRIFLETNPSEEATVSFHSKITKYFSKRNDIELATEIMISALNDWTKEKISPKASDTVISEEIIKGLMLQFKEGIILDQRGIDEAQDFYEHHTGKRASPIEVFFWAREAKIRLGLPVPPLEEAEKAVKDYIK